MTIKKVREMLVEKGLLDHRQLMCYATVAGTIQGCSFQNLTAVVFAAESMTLYTAKTDGSIGDPLIVIPYSGITGFTLKNRILYPYASLSYARDQMRFYNYDKRVFSTGFHDAGLI